MILHPGKKSVLTVSNIVDNSVPPKPIVLTDTVPVYTVAPEGNVSLWPSADGMTCDVVFAQASTVSNIVTVNVSGVKKTAIFQTLLTPPPPVPVVGDFTLTIGPEVDV